MTDHSRLLEYFNIGRSSDDQILTSEDEREELRLQAFEEGYTAGWDDATKAQSEDQARVATDFARNLDDLSFTYHEAYSHITKELKPLLKQVVDLVLPDIARASLGAQIVEQLSNLANELSSGSVEIVVAPANKIAAERLLDQELPFPVAIVEEPSLGEGQVYMQFGAEERLIDMDAVLKGIALAVSGFFEVQDNQERLKHG